MRVYKILGDLTTSLDTSTGCVASSHNILNCPEKLLITSHHTSHRNPSKTPPLMPPKKPAKAPEKPKDTTPAGSSSSSKGKGKPGSAASQAAAAASGSGSKGKGAQKGATTESQQPVEPPKPTLNEIIGGKGWTGKLPVTLFYELTVRNHWQKPDYTHRQSRDGHQSSVIVRCKNPKTKEIEEIRFEPPTNVSTVPSHLPSALEARHFAATYALHRVYSGRNLQYTLPPTHRPYWQAWDAIKKEDVKQGKESKYSEDPFQVQRDKIAADAQRVADREKAAAIGTAAASGAASISSSQVPKGWSGSILVNMGKGTRTAVEKFIRLNKAWTHDAGLDPATRAKIVKDLTSVGFRVSHAEEACEWATNLEDALEWLLIHVPEDDMPAKYLPDNYTVGAVAFMTDSLAREYASKRLSAAGYPLEAAREALAACGDNETRAAEILMQTLVYGEPKRQALNKEEDLITFDDEPIVSSEEWKEEQDSLEAIYADKYTRISADVCQIKLEVNSSKLPPKLLLEVRKPSSGSYPEEIPIWAVLSEPALPSHVRLSLIKRIAEYSESLKGEVMIFAVVDWLENSMEKLVDRPGKLREVSSVVAGAATIRSAQKAVVQKKKGPRHKANPINWTPGLPEALEMLKISTEKMDTLESRKMMTIRQSLPAWNLRAHIADVINSSPVTVISGETGSGKSTQCVQFVLDDFIERKIGTAARIICTQPRRISAIGLAERVSAERCGTVGSEVGYAIRGESKISSDTRITFMTTGVLLRRLHDGDGLLDVSHVFIDEVHERSLDSDFLLVLMKRLLTKRKDIKLVLMSATLNAKVFANYFGNVEIVNIEGRTFPVNDFYLDDVVRLTNFDAHGGGGRSKAPDAETADMDPAIGAQIRALGQGTNYDLIAAMVEGIDDDLGDKEGSILVFLSGTLEIHRALKAINNLPQSYRYVALPLHASLIPADQRRVFPRPPKGQRKIICATNVAETSITIEDVVAVIDTGRVKETLFDPESRMIRLTETWASRASCKQRRGRAGRVREGNCYKLFTRYAEENRMQEETTPEIMRVPLENVCLTIKAMGVKDVGSFLKSALTPPDTRTVDAAITTLTRMGALKDEDLTGLGKHLSTIPADVRSAKLMIYGAIFGCVDAAITIAAILAVKSPFVVPREKRDESRLARTSYGAGNGDLMADYRAYEDWSNSRGFKTTSELRRWCDENMLSLATLNDIRSNKSQYMSSMQEIGFLPFDYHKEKSSQARYKLLNSQNNNDALIRAIVASAFSPQIARIQLPEKKYASTMSGAKELDPEAKTIKYFTEDERAFLHPSSTLFDAQGFAGNASFMAYATKVATSKVFLRDVTPVNAYGLMLFGGGGLELDMSGRGVKVDGWLRVKCWLRIGVLVRLLRVLLDEELQRKVEDPDLDLGNSEAAGLVRRLIEFDGMDPA
ncbi:hypothetical protein H072_1272 [Dactylellina haptotyla CBS 200.50]|uniref:RNA helicase n=1 Tax=Dactylellina haptotyla (strain CBS 200.50) TaxID=1284197 RepID=S8BZ53_DACHA|nr:hypothetical protein H072_1272 [Dactylellina haptotyla CBS 200.50]